MKFLFILFATFLLSCEPLRNVQFFQNNKINRINLGIESCCDGNCLCSNNGNNSDIMAPSKLKQIIDTLLIFQKKRPKIIIFPKITDEEYEKGDWESGEIPWDFVDNTNVSVSLHPYSIAMLLS